MPPNPMQQTVERLRQANTVLVTVSANPSVDQLAACIGMTLLLNKAGKHATAVFSGKVPSTLEFLQPEKTLEPTTDSLQDFIISLDKSKADKLRYKVENDVVKIFITPYKTSLSPKDLAFSQGDFNVEVVLALGVLKREDLDQVILAHGRILHDATVIGVTRGKDKSLIGAINWEEPAASSLSEMSMLIAEALQPGLIDPQSATALLTGIVAETGRFSNQRTTPQVMSLSAQLMAAGANQQLIANKLSQQVEAKLRPAAPAVTPIAKEQSHEGTLSIEHSENEIEIDRIGRLKKLKEEQAANILPEPSPFATAPSESEPALAQPLDAPSPEDNAAPDTPEEPQVSVAPAATAPTSSGRGVLTSNGPDVGLTANTVPEHEMNEPLTDPMAMAKQYQKPLLSHHAQPPAASQPSSMSPAEQPTPDDLPSGASPTAPAVDQARAAVEQAASAVADVNPGPIKALNAQPLGPPLNPDPLMPISPPPAPNLAPEPVAAEAPPEEPVVNDPNSPPPVPPPMIPQFFDTSGKVDNPYLNPSDKTTN